MKRSQIYRISAAFSLSLILPLFALAQAGTLDPSFGEKGTVRYDFQFTLFASGLGIESDGKILIVGSIFNSHGDLFLLRLQPDGSRDLSFGKNGIFVYRLPNRYPYAASILFDRRGRIVIAGVAQGRQFLQLDAFVLRLLQNGAIDDTFASRGLFVLENAVFRDLKILPDGWLVLVGRKYTDRTVRADMLLMALSGSGRIVKSFNYGRPVLVNGKGYETAERIFVDSQKRLLVSGSTSRAGYSGRGSGALLMIRTDQFGRLDKSFGTNGRLELDFVADESDSTADLAVDPDGNIYTLDSISEWDYGLLLKQDSDGRIDRTFANSGKLWFFPENLGGISVDEGKTLLDREGGILLIVRKYIELSADRVDECVDVLRLRPNGHFDTEFNHGRERLLNFGLRKVAPVSVKITASNKLLILAGSDDVGKSVIAIARLNLD